MAAGSVFISKLQSRILDLSSLDIRTSLFLLSIFIYAAFGAPTPDEIGLAEIAIGLCLFFAAGLPGIHKLVRLSFDMPVAALYLRLFFWTGLVWLTLAGLVSGNPQAWIVRDVAAFLFLCLPLFMLDLFKNHPNGLRWLVLTIMILGLVFSLRSLPFMNVWLGTQYLALEYDALDYLSNAPTVLFTTIMLSGIGMQKFISPVLIRKGQGLVYFILMLLPLSAMAFSLQRAGLGYAFLSILLIWLWALWHNPKSALVLIFAVVVVGAVFFQPELTALYDRLLTKTSLYGFNMRFQEVQAVWEKLRLSPLSVIFGLGWGGGFESPAVGYYYVNYTHSLLSAWLLKGGIIGLLLIIAYIGLFLRALIEMLPERALWVTALAGPFLIPVFLYASYKSLDFGLILLLISLFSDHRQSPNSCKPGPSVVSKS